MFNDIFQFLWRPLAIMIALFTIVYTIIYYMIAISLLCAGACLGLIAWCIFCAAFQSVSEHVPLKRYFDRRLQENFIQKIKTMANEESNTRARLVQIIEGIKSRNKANNALLKKIRINETIIKRKFRGFESLVVDRYEVHPTIPGMLVPPHQEPESPSPSAFVRWLFAQDLDLYYHERGIAKYEAQISGELSKLQQLDEEEGYLRAILDDTNSKRSRVQLMPDLPKPYKMAESTRKYLEQFNPAKVVPSPYPYFVRPNEYRPISPPPISNKKPEPFHVEIPKMTLGPLLEAASRPPLPVPLSLAPPRNPDALFADPPRVVVGNTSAPAPNSFYAAPAPGPAPAPAPAPVPPPLFGPPPSANPFAPLFGRPAPPPPPATAAAAAAAAAAALAPATPRVAPAVPTSPPPAPNPLSLASRLRDPAGARARLPDVALPDEPAAAPAPAPTARPPPTNPLSLAARLTDPAGVRAPPPPPPPPSTQTSLFAKPSQPGSDREVVEVEAAEERRRTKEADQELVKDLLAARRRHRTRIT